MIPTRKQLEEGRIHNDGRICTIYGYFWSFCELQRSCDDCNKIIRFGCKVKRKIEVLQEKMILRICKEPPKDGE